MATWGDVESQAFNKDTTRIIDIDFDVLESISEKQSPQKSLTAADFKRQALISFIQVINHKTEKYIPEDIVNNDAEINRSDYKLKDQICFAAKILDLRYSDDALNYACQQIARQGKEYDLDYIGDLLFSIGINAVSTRIEMQSLSRLKVGDFVQLRSFLELLRKNHPVKLL